MTLEQLRIFVCVAERLNMTRAAEVLHITQSGVSASISALENTYGTPLFDRVGRRIELSAAGHTFLEEAEKVLHQVGAAQRALSDLSNLRRGVVSVCASRTIGNYFLPEIITEFQIAWPNLDIDLQISSSADAVRMVVEGKAEIGLIEGTHGELALTNFRIPGDELCVVVRPDHAWANGVDDIADLMTASWVLREQGSVTRSEFMRGIDALGLRSEHLDVRLELPSNEAVRSAVMAGAGPGALSCLAVADALTAGSLVRVDVELPQRSFRVLRHADRKVSRAANAFLQFLPGWPAERRSAPPISPARELYRLSA
jgi:DNA-binding transcriptional LysR family regulator